MGLVVLRLLLVRVLVADIYVKTLRKVNKARSVALFIIVFDGLVGIHFLIILINSKR
jgi:hypothetical protein